MLPLNHTDTKSIADLVAQTFLVTIAPHSLEQGYKLPLIMKNPGNKQLQLLLRHLVKGHSTPPIYRCGTLKLR
jgi:hypothetical protein